MPSAIVLDRLVKRYGSLVALNGVSLEVPEGQMFGLIGPDGAGKTTMIRTICGLLHADGGSVRVFGKDPVARARRDHGGGRISLAALQPVRRSQHRREHRVLRRDPRAARLSGHAAIACSS